MDTSNWLDCAQEDQVIAKKKKKKKKEMREIESLLIAADNNTIRTNYIKKQKSIIRNRLASVGYVETEIKRLIT